MNATDNENIIKAQQCADLLAQDLRELLKSKNNLLQEITIDMLRDVNKISDRLIRISKKKD